MAMKNSQALRENRRTQRRGNGQAAESRRKEISSARQEQLQPEVRVDGKYIWAVLVDPRDGRVAKVTARRKLIAGRARQVLGLKPGNSDWSVLVTAVRVPVGWHEELVAEMEKALRKQRGDREVDDPRPSGRSYGRAPGRKSKDSGA